MDTWSDACLEFAFKTLTGAMPVEENIAIQGRFQEPLNAVTKELVARRPRLLPIHLIRTYTM
ncbi:hypothetical protein JHK85_002578 [Glycine max]|nr:hypothetical protein JHK85_002578 [Glycine max]